MLSPVRALLDLAEFILLLLFTLYAYAEEIRKYCFPPKLKSLKGEVILITGSGRGIGRELCLNLADSGATLVLWSRTSGPNEEVADEVNQRGGKAYPFTVDVGDRKQVEEAAVAVKNSVGSPTIVINNAGLMKVMPFLETKPEEIESLFRVNVLSNFWVLKEFLPSMISQGRGHLVSVCSASGILPTRNIVPYSSSKHAVHGYIEALKDELRHHPEAPDIKFTTAFPFYCSTEMLSDAVPNSRFPLLFPIVGPELVAKKVVEGMRRESEYIYTPVLIGWLAMFSWLVSTKAIAAFGEFLQVNIDPLQCLEKKNGVNGNGSIQK